MIGNKDSVKGGITSVISQIRKYDWDKENIMLDFIPTYLDTNKAVTVMFFACAYVKIFFHLLLKRPEVVYAHMSYHGSFYRKNAVHKLCKLFKIRYVIHLHGSEFEKWYTSVSVGKQKQVRSLLRSCDTMIVLGNKWYEAIKKIEPKTNIKVLMNTVPLPEKTTKFIDGQNSFLFLAVLIKRKGAADLIKAVKLLVDKGEFAGWTLKMAGTGA